MSEQATILVVDDDEAIRYATQLRLSTNGYRTLTASDGDDAVAMAKTLQPSAIVMDVRMPRIDGLTALRTLRMDPTTENIPVVMLSASPDDQTVALDDGAQFYIQKPYSKESLLAAVNAALESANPEKNDAS